MTTPSPQPCRPSLSKLLRVSKPQLQVCVEQEMTFVHPTLATDDAPSEGSLIRGTVFLSLPKSKTIARITVALEGLCDAYGGQDWRYETSSTLSKHLALDLQGEVLEAGDHAFNFSFIIPSQTAVFQRSSYGRVRHYLKATAEFGASIRVKIHSPPVAIWISAVPASHGELPEPLNVQVEHFTPELGPLAISLSSPHLTISSLVQVRLSFLAPSFPIEISKISACIDQAFVVHYSTTPNVARPPSRRFVLPVLSPVPDTLFRSLSRTTSTTSARSPSSAHPPSLPTSPISIPHSLARANESYRTTPLSLSLHPNRETAIRFFVRVPTDDVVRPTTLPATQTNIRVSHALGVELRYRRRAEGGDDGGVGEGREGALGEEQVLRLGKDVVIASCCCLQTSAALPSYSPSDTATATFPPLNLNASNGSTTSGAPPVATHVPIRRAEENHCLCSMSLEEFYDREGVPLERPGWVGEEVEELEARVFERDEEVGGRVGAVGLAGQRRREEKSAAFGTWAEMSAD